MIPFWTLRRMAGRILKEILMRFSSPVSGNTLHVLTYHSVDESGSALSVSPAQFEDHLRILHNNGWKGLSAAAAADRLSHPQKSFSRPEVLITFDDGYTNFEKYAFPLLQQYGFPAAVFVVTDMIGQTAQWLARDRAAIAVFLDKVGIYGEVRKQLEEAMDQLSESYLMDWPTLRMMVDNGIDIESHTAGHFFLTTLTDEELRQELEKSKRMLDKELGTVTRLLAYPYGDADRRVCQAAETAGYQYAFMAEKQAGIPNEFQLERTGVGADMSGEYLLFLMSPAGRSYQRLRKKTADWAAKLKQE